VWKRLLGNRGCKKVAGMAAFPSLYYPFLASPMQCSQASMIIGFDIAKIQPRLNDIEQMKPIAWRIEWVHGNLSVFPTL
jgi:hypothetical protein